MRIHNNHISRSQASKIRKNDRISRNTIRYWYNRANTFEAYSQMLQTQAQIKTDEKEYGMENLMFPNNGCNSCSGFDPLMSDFYEGIDKIYDDIAVKYECPNGFLKFMNRILGRKQ